MNKMNINQIQWIGSLSPKHLKMLDDVSNRATLAGRIDGHKQAIDMMFPIARLLPSIIEGLKNNSMKLSLVTGLLVGTSVGILGTVLAYAQ